MTIRIEPASVTDAGLIANPEDSLFLKPAFRHALAREYRLEAVNLWLQVKAQNIIFPAYRKCAGQRQRLIIGAGFDKSGEIPLPPGLSFTDCMNVLAMGLQQSTQENITHLEIRSKHAIRGLNDHSDKVELVIQPDKPSAEWMMDFSKSTRRNIRLPFKQGFHFEIGTEPQQLGIFYSLYLKHMHQLGSLSHSYGFFHELWEKCRDNINIFVGYIKNSPAIASFQFLSHDEVYSAWVGIDADYKHQNVLLGLIWSLTEFCEQTDRPRYNLGRSSVSSGAYGFKKRLANREQRIYYYDLNLHTGKSALPGKLRKPVYKSAAGLIRNSPPRLMQSLSRHLLHRFY